MRLRSYSLIYLPPHEYAAVCCYTTDFLRIQPILLLLWQKKYHRILLLLISIRVNESQKKPVVRVRAASEATTQQES